MLSNSIVSVQREFCRKFGDDWQCGAAPSRKIISQWVHQWRETGSLQVKACTRRNTVQSPKNIQRVRKDLERSPRQLVRRHSQLLNLSDRSVRRTLHDFQQDGATAHTARLSMNTLRTAFPGCLLSQFGDIQWFSNSLDVTTADFFYGGI